MRINVLSDLHLGLGVIDPPDNDADLVVLAGDIARPKAAIDWASTLDKPVLYVPGNHEFYGHSIAGTLADLRRLAAGTSIRMLDDDEVIIGGVRFLGTTLWTDFALSGEGAARDAAMCEAQRFMRDFAVIRIGERPFTPADSAALFERHARWLGERLAEPFAGPTVVITHHAPSPRSVHPRFADSPLNPSFVSDLEHLLGGARAALWIHGHTHDSFDYDVAGTRVVCNPRGYAMNGANENRSFDPDLCIVIG